MRLDQKMLKALLTQGKLTAQEREKFESMWDQTYRTKKLSHLQMAVIEKAYFGQELHKSIDRPAQVKRGPKVAFIYSEQAKRRTVATNMKQFQAMCPDSEPGSALYKRVESFFGDGGQRFEIRPGTKPFPK